MNPTTPSQDTPLSNLTHVRLPGKKLTTTNLYSKTKPVDFDPSRPEIKARFRQFANDGYLNASDLKKGLTLYYQAPIAEQISAYLRKNCFNDFVTQVKLSGFCEGLNKLANDNSHW
jgi:hypothetical protein